MDLLPAMASAVLASTQSVYLGRALPFRASEGGKRRRTLPQLQLLKFFFYFVKKECLEKEKFA